MKAVAFKAIRFGLETLCSSTVTVPEDYEGDKRMIDYCIDESGGQSNVEAPPETASLASQETTEDVDEYGRLLRRTVIQETGQVIDTTRSVRQIILIYRINSTTICISYFAQ